MTDGVSALANVSGLSRESVLSIWEQVKANAARLDACPRHRFEPVGGVKLGEKLTCTTCGGTMGLVDIGNYIKGYVAAGKSADDVWPGFNDRRRK